MYNSHSPCGVEARLVHWPKAVSSQVTLTFRGLLWSRHLYKHWPDSSIARTKLRCNLFADNLKSFDSIFQIDRHKSRQNERTAKECLQIHQTIKLNKLS